MRAFFDDTIAVAVSDTLAIEDPTRSWHMMVAGILQTGMRRVHLVINCSMAAQRMMK